MILADEDDQVNLTEFVRKAKQTPPADQSKVPKGPRTRQQAKRSDAKRIKLTSPKVTTPIPPAPETSSDSSPIQTLDLTLPPPSPPTRQPSPLPQPENQQPSPPHEVQSPVPQYNQQLPSPPSEILKQSSQQEIQQSSPQPQPQQQIVPFQPKEQEICFYGAPYPKLPPPIFPYIDPSTITIYGPQEHILTKWPVLGLTQPPPPISTRPPYPPMKYTYETPRIRSYPYFPKTYDPENLLPSQTINEHGPLLETLIVKAFPLKQTYANLVKMKPYKIPSGTTRTVIPPWETVPAKMNAELPAQQKSRTFGNKDLILTGRVEWKKFLHPVEYGKAATYWDHYSYAHFDTEKKMDKAGRADKPWFMPLSWLKISETTKIGIVPEAPCPQIPFADMNKNKEHKLKRQKETQKSEGPMLLDSPETLEELEELMSLMENQVKNGLEMQVEDALKYWNLFMLKCSSEASSSGLSVMEKQNVDKTELHHNGAIGFRPVRMFDLSEDLSAPISSPVVQDYEVNWVKEYQNLKLVETADSDDSMSSIDAEATATIVQPPSAAPASPEQSSGTHESIQPLAMIIQEKGSSSKQSAPQMEQFDPNTFFQNQLKEFKEEIKAELRKEIKEEVTAEVTAKVTEKVKSQVQSEIAPQNVILQNMVTMLQSFLASQPPLNIAPQSEAPPQPTSSSNHPSDQNPSNQNP